MLEIEIDQAKAALRQHAEGLVRELTILKGHPRDESIHDTRVQSRRMRAALEAFRDLMPPDLWQECYAIVRGITRTLGDMRETEAMLLLMNELAAGTDPEQSLCREYLDGKLRSRLKKQNGSLGGYLRGIDLRRLRSLFRHLLARTGDPGTAEITGDFPNAGLDRARRILEDLSKPLLSFPVRAGFPRTSDRRLHKLRIAAKKLRYAMEIFSDYWPGGLNGEIALARAFQDAAGHHQDWAVLEQFLEKTMRKSARRNHPCLVAQIRILLAGAQVTKKELRNAILPALTELQASLRRLLAGPAYASRGR